MTNISNSIIRRDPYKTTKKGAAVGAGIGTVGALGFVAANSFTRKAAAGSPEIARAIIQRTQDSLAPLGVDFSKTTVSKLMKQGVRKGAMKSLAVWTLIGTSVGAVVDFCKNK